MLRAVLIDDEEIALDVLEILLMEVGGISVAGKFRIVSDALEQTPELNPDLIFLDIEMPGANGLIVGETLNARCPDAKIIFVTAYHQYAVEAFETNAIGYLLKPVAKERLMKTLSRYEVLQAKAAKHADPSPVADAVADAGRAGEAPRQFLSLKVMGSLELYDEGGRLATWRTKKTKELFAFLWSFNGEPAYRYHILDQLWPELDSERAQALFHTTLYNLRHMLRNAGFPDMVVFRDERYWMRTEYIRSDVDRMEAIMQGAVEHGDQELISLYRGDYLETEHYGWAELRRNDLRSAYMLHLDRLAKDAVGLNKGRLLWKLFEMDPYRENLYERLQAHLLEAEDTASILRLSQLKKKLEQEAFT